MDERAEPGAGEVEKAATRALLSARGGDRATLDALMEVLYREFHALAAERVRWERAPSLSATALVNEAYLRLVDQHAVDWEDRSRFLAAAAAAIRRVLVDHARRRQAEKRGGEIRHVTLLGDPAAGEAAVDLLALDEALDALAAEDPRQARVVVLRYFGGLGVAEVARELGTSERTVKGDWAMARAWLHRRLSGSAP